MTRGTAPVTSDGTQRDAPRPFVGRTAELGSIDQVLTQVRAGHGQLLVITGEAGMGKTRVAEELAERARAEGMLAIWGTCWSGLGTPPLWPWHELLAEIDPARATELLESADLEPFARSRAVVELVRDVAGRVPVVLVIDDGHLADPSAISLARFAVRSLRSLPVLVVVTWRAALNPPPPDLPEDGAVVRLRPLPEADVRELVRQLAAPGRPAASDPAGAAADAGLASEVVAVSGGNPLLVAHAVAELVDRGDDRRGSGSPVLRRRLDELSPADLDVLTTAAVIGPSPTVEEVAAVGGATITDVAGAVRRAHQLGFVTGGDRVELVHDLVRTELVDGLDLVARRGIHARAARLLGAGGHEAPARLAARAEHALAAAGDLPLTEVVEACRAAASSLVAGGGSHRAEGLLDKAVGLHDQPGMPAAPPELLVEHAEATLARGRLGEARPRFWRAAEAAEGHDDPGVLTRAALGLGGVWAHEHRSPDRLHAYLGLLERAHQRCTDESQRLELAVRWGAERVYLGVEDRLAVADAVDALQARGEPGPLARSLSLLHHTMLGPSFARERSAIAHEVLANASRAGDALTALMGTMWLAVDAFLVGDPNAPRWHDELRVRAEALDLPAVGFIAEAMDVMLLLRAGQFTEAEDLAGRCVATGSTAGDADAVSYYGAHLLCSRWMRGTAAELIPTMRELRRDTPNSATGDVYSAVQAAVAAFSGDTDEAVTVIESLRASSPTGSVGVPAQTSVGLLAGAFWLEAADTLGDAELAAEQGRWMASYAGLPVMASLAVACFGSAERPMGLAARAQGDLDSAALHFSRAASATKRLGNRPVAAICLAEWAETLTRAGDRTRARALWSEAIEAGTALGLDGRLEAWVARRDELRNGIGGAVGRLQRRGKLWELSVPGRQSVVVPDSVGMTYLATLVERCGSAVSVSELTGAGEELSVQELLDPQALARYRNRISELEADLAEADRFADLERSARARMELDEVLDLLRRELRPGGRSRRFADQSERARSSVQKALRRVVDKVEETDPVLADLIRRSITTGFTCRFAPAQGLPERRSVVVAA